MKQQYFLDKKTTFNHLKINDNKFFFFNKPYIIHFVLFEENKYTYED